MADRLRQPANRVARAAIWLWAGRGMLSLVVIVALLTLVAWILSQQDVPGGPMAWLSDHAWALPSAGALVAGVPLVLVQPPYRYAVHRWEVTSDLVYTRTGWLDRRWHLVPISRIQTVDTDRGPIERVFDLATVRIHTASHAGSSTIEGLPLDVATELAGTLAERANGLRDDAT
jgi:membrane protein YdbS with pleckstrin-like domain